MRSLGRRALLSGLLALTGCALAPAPPAPPCAAPAAAGEVIWLLHRGMHLELILPASGLEIGLPPPPLGIAAIAFGFGKRSFMRNEAGSLGELVLGVLPGEGVVEVTPLPAPPEPRPDRPVWRLALPPGGMGRLQRFLAESIARSAAGPRMIEALPSGRVLYAAVPRYSLAYTCNSWVADGLRRAGLPLRIEGVVLAADVLRQLPAWPGFCALDAPAGLRLAGSGPCQPLRWG
ncbi:MAG: DUF2459 domain-containing protein [Rhodovarius sp.]|nr:DUF2459 domain-containing protein [Rhodovarius sp.]